MPLLQWVFHLNYRSYYGFATLIPPLPWFYHFDYLFHQGSTIAILYLIWLYHLDYLFYYGFVIRNANCKTAFTLGVIKFSIILKKDFRVWRTLICTMIYLVTLKTLCRSQAIPRKRDRELLKSTSNLKHDRNRLHEKNTTATLNRTHVWQDSLTTLSKTKQNKYKRNSFANQLKQTSR